MMEHEKTTRCRKSQRFRPQPLTAQLLKIPAKSPVTGDLRRFPCNFTIFRSLTYEKPRLPGEVSECTSFQNQWPFFMGKLTIFHGKITIFNGKIIVWSKKLPQLPQVFASTALKFPAPGLNRRQVAWRWEPVVPGAHWISHPSPNCMKYWLAKKYINININIIFYGLAIISIYVPVLIISIISINIINMYQYQYLGFIIIIDGYHTDAINNGWYIHFCNMDHQYWGYHQV